MKYIFSFLNDCLSSQFCANGDVVKVGQKVRHQRKAFSKQRTPTKAIAWCFHMKGSMLHKIVCILVFPKSLLDMKKHFMEESLSNWTKHAFIQKWVFMGSMLTKEKILGAVTTCILANQDQFRRKLTKKLISTEFN